MNTVAEDSIFKLTAPYDSDYQGTDPRYLFVCSVGLVRSATAARIAGEYGINARACGSEPHALIPISVNLIEWAQKIIFMREKNRLHSIHTFETNPRYVEKITRYSDVWDIKNEHYYMGPELIRIIRRKLEE